MNKLVEELVLVVPDDLQVRNEIRKNMDKFISQKEFMPPVLNGQLSVIALNFLHSHKYDNSYLAFVMICCGNAIWRKVVETIPYNRRILLLPQCLRNSTKCVAESDQFGLLCKNCGQCSIPSYIDDAEQLGYIVLISEGTTVTTQLIESGQIDAVIGVGCMEVLQKMYDSVQKYAVPGIGIPLQNCGCIDTSVDSKWVKEEIYNINQKNGFRLLNTNQIKTKTSSIFEEKELASFLGNSGNEIEAIAIKSILAGGNRYRVFLTALAYEAFCEKPNSGALSRLALSVECFHKASLIHDDIEDNDDSRYGKSTVHFEHGVPIAINTGDFLIGEGYRLITEAGLSPEITARSIELISKGHRTLAMGQGIELLCTRKGNILPLVEMLQVFEQKTATAFKVSLLLGAIAGGADRQYIQLLDNFSRNLGIAYQIMDDIIDYQNKNGDIEKRKFSVLLSMLYSKISKIEQENLLFLVKSNDFESIYRLIEDHQIKKQAVKLLKEHIQKAQDSINDLQNTGLKIALHQILGKMFKEYI
jgi:geranylgeranyl diphosphate synthase, type II